MDSVLRIVDANLNRAAEGLRVAEDVCRFHWNLGGLASELKAIRHALFELLARGSLSRPERLDARDVEGDVGRSAATISAVSPAETLAALAFTNVARAREAIRSLEEVCRLADRPLAARIEALRYKLYAIEKAIGGLENSRSLGERLRRARFCLLATSRLYRRPLLETVVQAISAGVDVVELREKEGTDRERLRLARELREATVRAGVLFVVNDRPDLALLSHADGVHVGQDDLAPQAVRAIVGREGLVGVSTHSLAQAMAASLSGADFIGVGPVFASRTKDAGPLLGLDGLAEVVRQVRVPAFAIGGIGPENIDSVIAAGAQRVAVSAAILGANDPGTATAKIRAALPEP
jgi:thiamine-phosphate pyrophosphorylase